MFDIVLLVSFLLLSSVVASIAVYTFGYHNNDYHLDDQQRLLSLNNSVIELNTLPEHVITPLENITSEHPSSGFNNNENKSEDPISIAVPIMNNHYNTYNNIEYNNNNNNHTDNENTQEILTN